MVPANNAMTGFSLITFMVITGTTKGISHFHNEWILLQEPCQKRLKAGRS